VERVASNRRPRLPSGKTVHRYGRPPEELKTLSEGLIDPDVLMVRFDRLDGTPLGAFCNYACHPTAAGGDCHPWISADLVGFGCRKIEAALAGAPCLFLQGCAGDIGTGKWVTGTPRQDTEAMGQRFAHGALQALENLQPIAVNSLCIMRIEVPVAFDPFPPVDELRRMMEQAVANGDYMMIAHGDALVVALQRQDFERAWVAGIALGDLAIACLPGEVFVEFGLNIKRRSPFRHTLVCAYNDNSLQYIPTAAAFPEGEYEVNGGWRYIAAGEGEKLEENTVKLLTSLKIG
jgi:neutral ceramidase